MRAYKGFTPQPDGTMECLTKTYTPGETYTEPSAVVCSRGMHAVTLPLDALSYYKPTDSVYHEVEVDESTPRAGGDSKVVSKRLVVGAKLPIAGLVKAHVGVILDLVKPATAGASANSATAGYSAHSATLGDESRSSASGDHSIAAALGPNSQAKGAKGCWLVLAEYDNQRRPLAVLAVHVGHKKQGKRIKADTWYSLIGGKVVEVNADGEAVA